MIEIRIDDHEVRNLLGTLQGRLRTLSPAMKQIAGIMHDAVEENFEQEGRPKWDPLKKSTQEQRKKEAKWPGKILQKSAGGLAASISRSFNSYQAVVGSNKKYAAIHQFGGKTGPHIIRPKRKQALFWPGAKHPARSVNHPGSDIPARPFLKLTDGDMSEIKSALMDYILRGK
jgi:phage virion morphogenesis protein